MEQFNLEKYLENPSRKVVTRSGEPVEILNYEVKGKCCIYAKATLQDGEIFNICTTSNGEAYEGLETDCDLFFSDNEEELTEFEKAVEKTIPYKIPIDMLKSTSQQLLDVARKEIEEGAVEFAKSYMEDVNPSFEKVQESEELWKWKMSCLRGINKAYEQGKQDALKSSPKWKKDNNNLSSFTYRLDNRGDGNILLCRKGYAINLIELLNLPIEN